jgi:hypothetical protein
MDTRRGRLPLGNFANARKDFGSNKKPRIGEAYMKLIGD